MAWTAVASNATTFADGNGGHVYTFSAGAPSAGQLDVLCINSNTTVSTPSTGGAAWTLGPTHVGNQGAYLWYRVATGGEGSTTTITTAGNFATGLGWSRWSNQVITADQNAVAFVDGTAGLTTPAVTTGTLAAAGELSIAFAALHDTPGSNVATPAWSTGYTELITAQSGQTAADVAFFIGTNTNAGTAAQSPNVTWTNNSPLDRYILVQTFQSVPPAAAAGYLPDAGDRSSFRRALIW